MAASFALRIPVPPEPQQLFLHFQGTPLRLDTVTSCTSSGPTRAVGPRRSTTTSTTTTWTTGSPTSPSSSSSSTRGSDGMSTPTHPRHRDELPTSDGTARAPRRLPLILMPSSSGSAESRFLVRERHASRKSRRRLRQQPRQELLLAEASRSIRVTNAGQTPSTLPRALPVEPTEPAVLAGVGPIALDPAISSLRGRLINAVVVGSREETVALAPGAAFPDPENASSTTKALGAPPAPSTLLPPAMAEDRRSSPAVAERTAVTRAGNETAALPVRCQCGLVSFSTPNMAPVALYHCHCTECRKQSASAFGTSALYPAAAFFPLAAAAAQRLKCWTRPTDAGGRMHCYFCPDCGSRLFHRAVDADGTPRATVSVKAGCVEGLDWRGAAHIYTRSAVVAIPDGAVSYETLPDETPQGDGDDGTTPRLRT